jgi:hypothetical protein
MRKRRLPAASHHHPVLGLSLRTARVHGKPTRTPNRAVRRSHTKSTLSVLGFIAASFKIERSFFPMTNCF